MSINNKGERMKSLNILVAGLYIAFAISALGLTFYGVFLAFSASILLGVASLFIAPSNVIYGVAMYFFDKNIPELLIAWLQS